MLAYKKVMLDTDYPTTIEIDKVDGAAYAKVFAWLNLQPIAPDKIIDL